MTHDSESCRRALAVIARIFVIQTSTLLIATTVIIISISLGYPIRSAAQSTMACPSGTYDMLDWMTLDTSLRANYHMEGTSNPLYTIIQPGTTIQSGKFYWIKGGGGLPVGHSTLRQQLHLFVDHGTLLDRPAKL